MLSAEALAIALIIVVGAYTVFGLTGFGSTVLAVPLLALLLPIKFVVPLLMLLDLVATLVAGVRFRHGIRVDELGWLAPFMLIGMVIGLTLLIRVPGQVLIIALGVFVLAYAVYGLTRRGPLPGMSRMWGVPIGVAGGALSALFGTGGVLFAIYTSARIRDKAALRATTASTIMFTAVVRLVLFGASGLLTQDGLLETALVLAPAMLGGFALGNRMHAAAPAALVIRVVYILLIVAGVSLLFRASTL